MPEPTTPERSDEIPEPAVRAVAERMLQRYESEYQANHLTWRDFADDARSDLAAALPHLDATLDRERLHREGYEYARSQGWNPRGANQFAAHYVEQVVSGNTIGNEYRLWDVQQFSRRDCDPAGGRDV